MEDVNATEVTKGKPTHRRSRRGCRTCRVRKKKCSEVYNEEGVCERCAAGGWECDRSSRPASRLPPKDGAAEGPVGPKRRCSDVHSAAGVCTSCENTGWDGDDSGRATGRLPPQRSRSIPGPERSGSNQSTSSTSTSHSLVSTTSSSTAASSATSILEASPFVFLPHQQQGMFADSMSVSPGRHASPGLLDSPEPGAFPPVYRPYSLQPSVVPSPPSLGVGISSNAALGPRSSSQPPRRAGAVGKQLSCTVLEWGIKELAEGRETAPNSLTVAGAPSEASEACDLAAAKSYYEEVDDGISLSLPEVTRHLHRPRLLEATFTKELPRLAALAMCTSIRSSLWTLGGAGRGGGDHLAMRAQKYHQRAMGALQVDSSPVDIRLGALLDLARFQMEQHGAGAGYSSLSICDLYITSILGPSPLPYSPLLTPEANIHFRQFALADVLRAVALNRRSLFNFAGGAAPYTLPAILLDGDFISGDQDLMRGVPVHLALCIAAACNLAQDEATMDPGQFLGQATLIERAVEGWQATSSVESEEEEQLFHRATAEMWRHAALIHLRTTLFHLGPLHTSIRNSLKLILSFGSRRYGSNSPLSVDVHGLPAGSVLERSLPWFMAATVSLNDGDRERCRVAIGMGLPLRAAKDRLHCASRIWELTDGCGFPINWTTALAAEGLFVAF